MSTQLDIDFISAPAYRQVARHEYVLRVALERHEQFRDGFYDWLRSNFRVWERFEREANAIWTSGRRHYSARTLWEFMRHETALREKDGDFKLNDHWPPSCARLYVMLYDDRAGFFETRGKAAA